MRQVVPTGHRALGRALGVLCLGLTVALQPTPRTAPALPAAWPTDPGRVLAFADDFNNGHLDTGKWTTCFWWTTCSIATTGELEIYTPRNVSVPGGDLQLTAREQLVKNSAGTYPYTSGMISTGGRNGGTAPGFAFTYGYAEIRAKFPAGRGLWPAFWLLAASHAWPPELDVVEVLGQKPTELHHTVHFNNAQVDAERSGYSWDGPDSSTGYHTYGIDWRPDSVTWYVDGFKARTYTGPGIPKVPMYLIADLAVGGSWAGTPDSTTTFPASMSIDSVRVWTFQVGR